LTHAGESLVFGTNGILREHQQLDTTPAYTDEDLATDMNALTFAERQIVEEDIHGVADIIEETTEFVMEKIKEMQKAIGRLDGMKRQAWDRAVFLRPALSEDHNIHLMFLRARRFRTDDAAIALTAYFRSKRNLFGEDLFLHRITWDDVCNCWKYCNVMFTAMDSR